MFCYMLRPHTQSTRLEDCVEACGFHIREILRFDVSDSTQLRASRCPSSWLRCLSKALDRLVPVSSKPHGSSTPGLSTICRLHGILLAYAMRNLISRLVSRLDAFSVYPSRT